MAVLVHPMQLPRPEWSVVLLPGQPDRQPGGVRDGGRRADPGRRAGRPAHATNRAGARRRVRPGDRRPLAALAGISAPTCVVRERPGAAGGVHRPVVRTPSPMTWPRWNCCAPVRPRPPDVRQRLSVRHGNPRPAVASTRGRHRRRRTGDQRPGVPRAGGTQERQHERGEELGRSPSAGDRRLDRRADHRAARCAGWVSTSTCTSARPPRWTAGAAGSCCSRTPCGGLSSAVISTSRTSAHQHISSSIWARTTRSCTGTRHRGVTRPGARSTVRCCRISAPRTTHRWVSTRPDTTRMPTVPRCDSPRAGASGADLVVFADRISSPSRRRISPGSAPGVLGLCRLARYRPRKPGQCRDFRPTARRDQLQRRAVHPHQRVPDPVRGRWPRGGGAAAELCLVPQRHRGPPARRADDRQAVASWPGCPCTRARCRTGSSTRCARRHRNCWLPRRPRWCCRTEQPYLQAVYDVQAQQMATGRVAPASAMRPARRAPARRRGHRQGRRERLGTVRRALSDSADIAEALAKWEPASSNWRTA